MSFSTPYFSILNGSEELNVIPHKLVFFSSASFLPYEETSKALFGNFHFQFPDKL